MWSNNNVPKLILSYKWGLAHKQIAGGFCYSYKENQQDALFLGFI